MSGGTRPTSIAIAIAATLATLLVAACGSGEGSSPDAAPPAPAGAALDGREFWSTDVTENGDPRPLVEGTRIQLRFDAGRIGASAGCNSIGGEYSIVDGTLVVSPIAMTEIGCEPARHAQDDFVVATLSASPSVWLEDDTLRLATGTATIELLDRQVADPDRPLVGTSWEVTGFLDGPAATSFATEAPASVVFSADSTMSGFDGCTSFTAPVEIADGSVGGPVEEDGELQFGPVERGDARGCAAPEGYVEAFDRLFETGEATYDIDGAKLTVVSGAGGGATFVALD